MPLIPDFWSENQLYEDPNLCEKQIHLFDEAGNEVTEFGYEAPQLTMTFSGYFTYYFSLVKYPETISKTYELFLPADCTFEMPKLANF